MGVVEVDSVGIAVWGARLASGLRWRWSGWRGVVGLGEFVGVGLVVGMVGWDWVALARSGKMERAMFRAAWVSTGEGRVDEGVGRVAAGGADVAAVVGLGGRVQLAKRAGQARPLQALTGHVEPGVS